jgi:signal transduction histidine kinase
LASLPHTGVSPVSEGVESWRAVARLEARVCELEQENTRLRRFAAVAAHELTEPVVVAGEYASQLLDRLGSATDPQSRSDLEALSRGAARMRLTIETFLHEAHLADRALPREPVDLSALLEDSLRLLEHQIRAASVHVVAGPLPTVRGHELLLGIVFKNLLANALRYGTHGGAIGVTASRFGALWRISVENEGTPIQPHERRRIFEPFERGRRNGEPAGAGLGLAIVRSIVERHGGSIRVSRSPDGNRFEFTLPS